MKKIIMLFGVLTGSVAYANGYNLVDCQQVIGAKGYSAKLETNEGCRDSFGEINLKVAGPGVDQTISCGNFFPDANCGFPTQTTDGGGPDGVQRTISVLYSAPNGEASLFECNVPNY